MTIWSIYIFNILLFKLDELMISTFYKIKLFKTITIKTGLIYIFNIYFEKNIKNLKITFSYFKNTFNHILDIKIL